MEPEVSLPYSQKPTNFSYSVLQKFNPPPSYLLKIHYNIALPSMARHYKLTPFLNFFATALHAPFLSSPQHVPHAPPISLFLILWIVFGVQIRKLPTAQFSPLPCSFVPLRPKYLPPNPSLIHPQTVFLPHFMRPSFTPIQNDVPPTIHSLKWAETKDLVRSASAPVSVLIRHLQDTDR